MDAPTRLQHIRRVLNDLTKPDILVIEGISPGFGGMMISSSLLHSVGVFISQWSIPVIECSPVTWKSHLDKSLYVKSDQQDAVSIGVATIRVCQRELGLVESEMIYVV